MTDPLRDYVVLLGRGYRLLRRQPTWIAITLIQPVVWLLLYSQLFGKLPRLGGFGTGSYLEFLTPGIAILGAFSNGAWEGVSQFAVLPLMFISVILTSAAQMPAWMRRAADANPVNWAVATARSAMLGMDWGSVTARLAGLCALVVAMEALALAALGRYQRSL